MDDFTKISLIILALIPLILFLRYFWKNYDSWISEDEPTDKEKSEE